MTPQDVVELHKAGRQGTDAQNDADLGLNWQQRSLFGRRRRVGMYLGPGGEGLEWCRNDGAGLEDENAEHEAAKK